MFALLNLTTVKITSAGSIYVELGSRIQLKLQLSSFKGVGAGAGTYVRLQTHICTHNVGVGKGRYVRLHTHICTHNVGAEEGTTFVYTHTHTHTHM